jgi:hypothetical protein
VPHGSVAVETDTGVEMASNDRPWRRAGAAAYAADRVRRAIPPVEVHPPGGHLEIERDVAIEVRDGTLLSANVYRPRGAGPVPVLLCAHPYGKDAVPGRSRSGQKLNFQFRMLRQPAPIRFSSETSWEAPDPRLVDGAGLRGGEPRRARGGALGRHG